MFSENLRKKILKWLVSLRNSTQTHNHQYPVNTSNTPTIITMNGADPQVNNHNNVDSIEMYNEIYYTESNVENGISLFHKNATRYLESKNISIAELNITSDNLNDFVHKLLMQLSTTTQNYTKEDCSNYCTGTVRDILLGYKEIHGYMSLLICIFGTIANILNIIVLTRKDMCKTPINKILKWLAVTDMFVMIEYIPFSTYMYVISSGEHHFKYIWAVYLLFHMHFTQILHTISISLTVTLAIWRYVAIRHPHGKFATYLLSHWEESILVSFIISPILCFPTYFLFKVKEEHTYGQMWYHVDANEDTALYSFNFWVHSVLIKLLPCSILTIISFILIRVLCDATKRRIKLKQYNNPNGPNLNGHRSSKCDRRPDRTTMLLVAVLILFLITEFPQGILGLLSGIMSKCFFRRCYSLFGEVMDVLALINAAIGFVLYGLMSKQFRTSFKSLFFKTRLSGVEMTRLTGVTTTCV